MGSHRRSFLFSCFAFVFAVAAPLMMSSSQADAASSKKEVRIEGTLVAKDVAASQLSIRKQGGTIVVVTVPSTAKIERNGFKATLNAFKIKDFVQVRSTNGVVTKVEAVGP